MVVPAEKAEYVPDKEPTGFFPPLSEAESKPDFTPIRADGFVPNSVLVRLLWPERALEERQKSKTDDEVGGWKPPQLTADQLAQIGSKKVGLPRCYLLSRVLTVAMVTDVTMETYSLS